MSTHAQGFQPFFSFSATLNNDQTSHQQHEGLEWAKRWANNSIPVIEACMCYTPLYKGMVCFQIQIKVN